MKTEAETRVSIDCMLEEAGWSSASDAVSRFETEVPHGTLKTGRKIRPDYQLVHSDEIVAVVEAKREGTCVTEGLVQAQEYARKLGAKFAYATEGSRIYEIEFESNTSEFVKKRGAVEGFPTPKELMERKNPDRAPDKRPYYGKLKNLAGKEPRDYQKIAIRKVLEAWEQGKREILLNIATGTGKTYVAAQIVDKMMEACRNGRRPKVLFLAHRNNLAQQAYQEFGKMFGCGLNLVRIKAGEQPTAITGDVAFSIYQTMMANGYYKTIDPNTFDLVVVDECHYGASNGESEWREIFDHFSSAVHFGLTATPKVRASDDDTYKYFGDSVYFYSTRNGIDDGYLAPFEVVALKNAMENYTFDEEDDDLISGEIEDGKHFTEENFNRDVEIMGRERLRVRAMLGHLAYGEKTIVFCSTQRHALIVRDIINEEIINKYGEQHYQYCVRVTSNDGVRGDESLAEFKKNDSKMPVILTSSRKLGVGVDIPNLRNIVFMRQVGSSTEFKQSIGRGTRKCDEYGKTGFKVIDFTKAHRWLDADWDGPMVRGTGSDDAEFTKPVEKNDEKEMAEIKLRDGFIEAQIRDIEVSIIKPFEDEPCDTLRNFIKRRFQDLKDEGDLVEMRASCEWRHSKARELAHVRDNISDSFYAFDVISYVLFGTELPLRQQDIDVVDRELAAVSPDANRDAVLLGNGIGARSCASPSELDDNAIDHLIDVLQAILDANSGKIGTMDARVGIGLHRGLLRRGCSDENVRNDNNFWHRFLTDRRVVEMTRQRYSNKRSEKDKQKHIHSGSGSVDFIKTYFARNWMMASSLFEANASDPYRFAKMVTQTEMTSPNVAQKKEFLQYPELMKAIVMTVIEPKNGDAKIKIGAGNEMRNKGIVTKLLEIVKSGNFNAGTTRGGWYDLIQSLR